MNLAFLAGENVEIDIVDRLKSLGHIATHASERSPGRPDTAVLQAASQAGQVLITNDKDFGELVFRKHHRSAGVIQRYGGELLGAFVVIGLRTIRLRRVPD